MNWSGDFQLQVVKQRQTVFLYLPEHGGAQGQEDGLAGADAAAAPPQAGGDAVTQQLPAAAGQGDDPRRLGGVIVDAQGAPCRAVAPLGGEPPAHKRLFQREELDGGRAGVLFIVGGIMLDGRAAALMSLHTARHGGGPGLSGENGFYAAYQYQ